MAPQLLIIITVNLAIALSKEKEAADGNEGGRGGGLRVGLLDCDVYGPSIPMMMNLRGTKPSVTSNKKMIPLGGGP